MSLEQSSTRRHLKGTERDTLYKLPVENNECILRQISESAHNQLQRVGFPKKYEKWCS
jgi:hypothetical protein